MSSRTSKPKNGVLATEEGSIYANSIPEAADVRLAFHAGWRSSSSTVGFGEFLAAHVASRYFCCALRPAIAGMRTLVCELPEWPVPASQEKQTDSRRHIKSRLPQVSRPHCSRVLAQNTQIDGLQRITGLCENPWEGCDSDRRGFEPR